jgi:hypothetical protein
LFQSTERKWRRRRRSRKRKLLNERQLFLQNAYTSQQEKIHDYPLVGLNVDIMWDRTTTVQNGIRFQLLAKLRWFDVRGLIEKF